jgi:hypothetical protein
LSIKLKQKLHLFVWHFRNFPVVGDKKNFLKKLTQNFGKIALCGVVGSERDFRGFGTLPNKQNATHFTEKGTLFLCLLRNLSYYKTRKGRERNGKETGAGNNGF